MPDVEYSCADGDRISGCGGGTLDPSDAAQVPVRAATNGATTRVFDVHVSEVAAIHGRSLLRSFTSI